MNTKMRSKYPPTHVPYSVQQGQQGTPQPPIAEEEQTLPPIARIRWAQLRTGYCTLLDSYLGSICGNVDNSCPKCDVAPHAVNHIFNWGNITTDLKLIDLWEEPIEAGKWLDFIPSVLHDPTAQNNPPSLPFSPGCRYWYPRPVIACHSLWHKCSGRRTTSQLRIGSHTLLLINQSLLWYKCN